MGSVNKQGVPVRTFADWGDPPPGYCEAGLVEHCGGVKHEGNFLHSLTLTDIHSGCTECAALVVREQTLVVEGISMIRCQLPFLLRGLDTDHDSVFMNESLQSDCREQELHRTRSRPTARTGSSRKTTPWFVVWPAKRPRNLLYLREAHRTMNASIVRSSSRSFEG